MLLLHLILERASILQFKKYFVIWSKSLQTILWVFRLKKKEGFFETKVCKNRRYYACLHVVIRLFDAHKLTVVAFGDHGALMVELVHGGQNTKGITHRQRLVVLARNHHLDATIHQNRPGVCNIRGSISLFLARLWLGAWYLIPPHHSSLWCRLSPPRQTP